MSSEYLARLFQQRSQARIIRFDEQIVSLAGLDDLQLDLWERFLTPRSRDERESFLSKLHMAGRLPEYRLIGESELMLTIWAANVS